MRPPALDEPKEDGWRALREPTDEIEEPIPGKDYGGTYPQDLTVLYYWRPTYWKRHAT